MKVFLFLVFTLLTFDCDADELTSVTRYSVGLLKILQDKNKEAFKNLQVYPGNEIMDPDVPYFFGEGDGVGIVGFLQSKGVETKIYGPYGCEGGNTTCYEIVYYLSGLINPDTKGFFKIGDEEKYWGKGMLSTQVIVKEGQVMFYRTPFYYGAHAPWAGEYDI